MSIPPPGWKEGWSVTASMPVAIPPVAAAESFTPAVQATVARGQPAAEAAVRWRIGAATIDNFLVYGLYLLVCLVLHWRVANVSHLLVLLALGVVYHFVLESRDGQTVGKRRYGIQVVSLDGEPADPKAIAIRSVLRVVDSLPFWYLSGLISMVRTGAERRQRIGDVAAATKVIAIDGRAARQGTPGWMLPVATLLALAISVFAVIAVAEAGHRPLSSSQEAQFVAGCNNTSGGLIDCQCLLNRLEADGYDSVDSINSVVQQAESERLYGQSGTARSELTADALSCRR
jgi:uncharacterized RDD family membrane protein YckC